MDTSHDRINHICNGNCSLGGGSESPEFIFNRLDNPLSDSFLRLYDSNSELVAFDDDSGEGLFSSLTFTATDSGEYYASAASYGDYYTGNYSILATKINETNVLGSDENDYLIGFEGDNTYQFGMGYDVIDYSNLSESITLTRGGTVDKGSFGTDTFLDFYDKIIATNYSNDWIDGMTNGGLISSLEVNLMEDNLIINDLPGIGSKTLEIENFENINGTSNSDTLIGNSLRNILNGNSGDDFLSGEAGRDNLDGGLGDDFLYGGLGRDNLTGDLGNDYLYGEEGRDIIDGGLGDDFLYGGLGRDNLTGGLGNDYLYGEEGRDIIDGGLGDDFLYGGGSRDLLFGGDGNDTFFFGSARDSQISRRGTQKLDWIKDFDISNDKIHFSEGVSQESFSYIGTINDLSNKDINKLLRENSNYDYDAISFDLIPTGQTFVAINGSKDGFQSNRDLLVDITGFNGNIDNLNITTGIDTNYQII